MLGSLGQGPLRERSGNRAGRTALREQNKMPIRVRARMSRNPLRWPLALGIGGKTANALLGQVDSRGWRRGVSGEGSAGPKRETDEERLRPFRVTRLRSAGLLQGRFGVPERFGFCLRAGTVDRPAHGLAPRLSGLRG